MISPRLVLTVALLATLSASTRGLGGPPEQEGITPTSSQPHPANRSLQGPEPEPLGWYGHLVQAIDQLKRIESAKPHDSIRLRLLQLVAGLEKEAATAPAGPLPTEQEYWSNQLQALSRLAQEGGADRQDKLIASRHQQRATTKLSEMTPLTVRNLTACEEVYGFGAYTAVPEARYLPDQQMSLYAEVENFCSEATDDGYNTLIGSSCRLIDSEGNVALEREIPEIDDLCLTRRRDFHFRVNIRLPADLEAGDYFLLLTVTDRLSNKTGSSELLVTIVR